MRNKYNAKKVFEDGYNFDSKKEHAYYRVLKLRERAKDITGLIVHPTWNIVFNGKRVCNVILDFQYIDNKGIEHNVDVKGVYTAMSRLKHKLLEVAYRIEVEIVK